ncbi:hypothetical protein EVAR_67520_1 [Eumeta japonica]|uniref:Uncharacterized protein n=1 Tax=Eumeta variegata TaxID=151549 RepID=A0A4C1YZI7_EUMVA|nr:hypothetical protein EVAR_67520_1 [Eumeta japonica]
MTELKDYASRTTLYTLPDCIAPYDNNKRRILSHRTHYFKIAGCIRSEPRHETFTSTPQRKCAYEESSIIDGDSESSVTTSREDPIAFRQSRRRPVRRGAVIYDRANIIYRQERTHWEQGRAAGLKQKGLSF